MGAAESTTTGSAVEAEAATVSDYDQPEAESATVTDYDQPVHQLMDNPVVMLSKMEGVLDSVPNASEKIAAGATVKELALSTVSKGPESETPTKRSMLSARSLLSWRPLLSPPMTPGRTDLLFKRAARHNDPKAVYEGLNGPSLHSALNQPRQLAKALRHSSDASAKDSDGDRTALHWAAARGHLICIHKLLEAGARADVVDAHGRTAAQLAQSCEQPQAHDLIVYGPPKPDPKNWGTVNPGHEGLSAAAALNRKTHLRSLLERGYDFKNVNGFPAKCDLDPDRRDTDGDRAPLHWAAARGALECVEMLLAYGATPDLLDANGKTPAALALECNQQAIHNAMVTAMAKPRPPKPLPFHLRAPASTNTKQEVSKEGEAVQIV